MRLLVLGRSTLVALALASGGGCESNDGEIEQLCIPGQNVFCRCPNGRPATQPCEDSGMAFRACGPCDGTAPAQDTSGSSGPGGDAESGRPMLAACTDKSECATTICQDGYCTSPCYKPSDCPYPKAECVPGDAGATCVPACASDADCGGYATSCQVGHAIDGWVVHTCR